MIEDGYWVAVMKDIDNADREIVRVEDGCVWVCGGDCSEFVEDYEFIRKVELG